MTDAEAGNRAGWSLQRYSRFSCFFRRLVNKPEERWVRGTTVGVGWCRYCGAKVRYCKCSKGIKEAYEERKKSNRKA